MLVFISGGVRSGKSALGETYVETLATGRKVYLATAMVSDSEMKARVEKHQQDRQYKGFVTLECSEHIGGAAAQLCVGDTVLLDCLGNLLANEMFANGQQEQSTSAIANRLVLELDELCKSCQDLIIISNDVFSEGLFLGEQVEAYRQVLGHLHCALAEQADVVIECVGGVPLYHKGHKPEKIQGQGERTDMVLILGGSYQGKGQYARKLCGENPVVFDYHNASRAEFPKAFSAAILLHIEEGVRTLLQNGENPVSYFQQHLEQLKGKYLTGDEIGSGIVPMDAAERKWRDETGRVYSFLAGHADRVDRVYAGIPQTISSHQMNPESTPIDFLERQGLVHLYYGDGKGKTTAALGLGLRALGAGMRVILVQFLKGMNSSELRILDSFGDKFRLIPGEPTTKFTKYMTPEERTATMQNQLQMFTAATEEAVSEKAELVIFDELVDAVNLGAITLEQVERFLTDSHRRCEVVITGHNPKPEWFELCDYVTEMKKIQHPFDKGIRARDGIEK